MDNENTLVNGTIVKIVKKIDRWGTQSVPWPNGYELIGKLAVIKDTSRVEGWGYCAITQDDGLFYFPYESLEVHENQNILFLTITNSGRKITVTNTGTYLKDENNKDLYFENKQAAKLYIEENYDKFSDKDS